MQRALLIALAACGTNMTPQPMPAPTLASCVPNRDGQITADELPIALGAKLAYFAETNVAVTLTPASNGVFTLPDQSSADTIVGIGPVALAAQWYAAMFPAGQFVVDAGGGLDGIYHQDQQALWLDGTASQQMGANQTLIVYPVPLAVLRFPLVGGQTWTETGTLGQGTMIEGLPFLGSDQLTVDVTAGTQLDVPDVVFSPILRVRTAAVRAPTSGTPTVGKRTTTFMFECFGEVGRAESKQDEPSADFTTAAYLRRYALGVTP